MICRTFGFVPDQQLLKYTKQLVIFYPNHKGTRTRMNGGLAAVLSPMVAGAGGEQCFPLFYFFLPLFSFFSYFFARYANCGTVRPTGLHYARRRQKERMHAQKNIYFSSGGPRGNTYDSWAEALFIIVPKTSHECGTALTSH